MRFCKLKIMSKVFVLDSDKNKLEPCAPALARKLLKNKEAAVFRRFPFTIILKKTVDKPVLSNYQLKLDPGSKKTGIAIVNQESGEVIFAAELEHRGEFIKSRLEKRAGVRKSRRFRKTRYRKPRFLNKVRGKKKGWLAPSLMSRIYNVETWVRRLSKLINISGISLELVKFDMQKMENAEISGIEYQQGTLEGYEIREYLLEKYNRKCVYCKKDSVKLEIEHVIPKSRNGSNRVSNLVIACRNCNEKKASRTASEFGYKEIENMCKKPLRDASAVNITKNELHRRLKGFGLEVETGSGGLTKFNRTKQGLRKEHWIDASCVGLSTPKELNIKDVRVLEIKATGWGNRQMVRVDNNGFPRSKTKSRVKQVYGFQTGDIAKAVVMKGKKVGVYIGKVAIRSSGSFNIICGKSTIEGISYKYFKLLHSCDGYSYSLLNKNAIPPTSKDVGFLAGDL